MLADSCSHRTIWHAGRKCHPSRLGPPTSIKTMPADNVYKPCGGNSAEVRSYLMALGYAKITIKLTSPCPVSLYPVWKNREAGPILPSKAVNVFGQVLSTLYSFVTSATVVWLVRDFLNIPIKNLAQGKI